MKELQDSRTEGLQDEEGQVGQDGQVEEEGQVGQVGLVGQVEDSESPEPVVEEPQALSATPETVEEPKALSETSESVEGPKALSGASESVEGPKALSGASESVEGPEAQSLEPVVEEPKALSGASESVEGPRASAELKAIVEALIFASPDPLTPKALCKLLDSEPQEDVLASIVALKEDYERPGGLQLVEVAGGYQIVTRSDLHEWVRRLFHERSSQKLSAQALETLAVIAYRQPVTAAEITEIRGVNTSGVLNTLLERHLIKIVGRKQVVGRPFMYSSTKEFLIRFGLNDLDDLPKVEDMAEALGIENPLLVERVTNDDLLPLAEPDGDASAGLNDDSAQSSADGSHGSSGEHSDRVSDESPTQVSDVRSPEPDSDRSDDHWSERPADDLSDVQSPDPAHPHSSAAAIDQPGVSSGSMPDPELEPPPANEPDDRQEPDAEEPDEPVR